MLYSDKLFVFGKNGCIRAKWLSSGKSVFIRAKVVVFEQSVYMARAKVVVLGQSGCIRELFVWFSKVVLFEKKLLYSHKELVFG